MLRLHLLFVMAFFLVTEVHAQLQTDNTAKKLVKDIKSTSPDTNRINLELELGGYYLFKPGAYKDDLDSAFRFFNHALQLSNVLHSEKWRNEALKLKGDCYLEGANITKGEACFREVINYYHSAGETKKEAETWSRLGDCIPRKNNHFIDEIIKSYEHARTIYKKQKDTLAAAAVLKNEADALLYERKLGLAEAELQEVLLLLKTVHYRNLHYTFDLLAALNRMRGDLHTELFYRLEAIKSAETSGDMKAAPDFYYSLALTYYNLGMYNQAIVYVEKTIASLKNRHDSDNVFSIALKARILLAQNKKQQALLFLRKNITHPHQLNPDQLILLDRAYGDIYQGLGEYLLAENYYQKLVILSDHYDIEPFYLEKRVEVYIAICNFYISTKQYKKVVKYVNELTKFPKVFVSMLDLGKVALLQFKVDSASGNYISAIKYFELQKNINDSIFNATKSKQIEELEVKYETRHKEKELQLQQKNIQILKKQSQLERNQTVQTRFTRNIMIGGSCLLMLLSAVLYNRYRQKKRSNLLLEYQKKEISAKNTALEGLLQDNEWLLREVHHRVKNNMQIVMSLLNSQSAYLKDEAAIKAVKESRHRIQAMSLIHQKLYKTNDASNIYMPEYVSEVVDYLKESFKIEQTIYFDLEIYPIFLDALQALPVGLIINETITNAIKYAFPYSEEDRIAVRLTMSDTNYISLSVSDNGQGLPGNFNIDEINTFGMVLIKGLTEELGGEYAVSNKKGTTVHIVFRSANSLPGPALED